MPDGTTQDCPGYPGILSTMGLMPDGTSRDYPGYPGIIPGYLVYQDPGLSGVYRDTYYLRIHRTPFLVGLPGTVLGTPRTS